MVDSCVPRAWYKLERQVTNFCTHEHSVMKLLQRFLKTVRKPRASKAAETISNYS